MHTSKVATSGERLGATSTSEKSDSLRPKDRGPLGTRSVSRQVSPHHTHLAIPSSVNKSSTLFGKSGKFDVKAAVSAIEGPSNNTRKGSSFLSTQPKQRNNVPGGANNMESSNSPSRGRSHPPQHRDPNAPALTAERLQQLHEHFANRDEDAEEERSEATGGSAVLDDLIDVGDDDMPFDHDNAMEMHGEESHGGDNNLVNRSRSQSQRQLSAANKSTTATSKGFVAKRWGVSTSATAGPPQVSTKSGGLKEGTTRKNPVGGTTPKPSPSPPMRTLSKLSMSHTMTDTNPTRNDQKEAASVAAILNRSKNTNTTNPGGSGVGGGQLLNNSSSGNMNTTFNQTSTSNVNTSSPSGPSASGTPLFATGGRSPMRRNTSTNPQAPPAQPSTTVVSKALPPPPSKLR